MVGYKLLIAGALAVLGTASPGQQTASASAESEGLYRLPFADGLSVKVFDDFDTHRPIGRVDLYAVDASPPFKVVAAAAGTVMAIQDSYTAQQSGHAAKDCHNNYVWIAHPNGEWTNYSHVATGSAHGAAHLHVGDKVKAGQFIGYEGAVGCAMLHHVHFEVAVPAPGKAIDAGGFLLDNEGGKRERNPRFCGVPGHIVRKNAMYTATSCPAI